MVVRGVVTIMVREVCRQHMAEHLLGRGCQGG